MTIKYPRTYHLPWSPGVQSDDKTLKNIDIFENKNVVVSIKKDGENSTLYRDYCHARSMDSKDHVSRHWLKSFHSSMSYLIPEGWRVCGENLYAKHTIHYKHLESYFMAFSIWNENNICLSWQDTEEWSSLLGLQLVPVIYQGIFDKNKIHDQYLDYCKKMELLDEEVEGYVIRLSESFSYDNFNSSVAKYVRANHVQTNEHWMHSEVIPNILKK